MSNAFPKIISNNCKIHHISEQFEKRVGYKLNIKNPKSFNKKIQWLKIYYKNPLLTVCADKYAVRQYIAKKVGEKYLLPLVGRGIYDRPEDIDFSQLPNQFVLKTTDGYATNIICSNKDELDINETMQKLKYWMQKGTSHYYASFEWSYKNIHPRIICEQFIPNIGRDYKFLCFNGKVKIIYVCSDRTSGILKTDWFDKNWQHLPFARLFSNSGRAIKPPKKFGEMTELSERLAKDFPFVRIDFFCINGEIKIGEMTFYPGNGMGPFSPREWDYKLGKWLKLPPKSLRLPFELNLN